MIEEIRGARLNTMIALPQMEVLGVEKICV
jgi:hypothetical protein